MALTTDIIVGFPGETDEDFQQTCELVREIAFDNAFIFRYSRAATRPPPPWKPRFPSTRKCSATRCSCACSTKLPTRAWRDLLGTEDEILVEGESRTNDARFQGRTRTNRLVLIEANERWRGQLRPASKESTGFTYYAEPLLQPETV